MGNGKRNGRTVKCHATLMKKVKKSAALPALAINWRIAMATKPKCVWTEDGGDHPDNPPTCYRNGERHGLWECRYSYGRVETGQYVNDKKHGRWEDRSECGQVATGPYVNGERNGQWQVRHHDGKVDTGPYVDGKIHGSWERRYPDGRVECSIYENNERVSFAYAPCK